MLAEATWEWLVFPVVDPGRPRTGSSGRSVAPVLWWLVRSQWQRVAVSILLGGLWLGTQPLIPLFVGRAIDEGILAGSTGGLWRWGGALAAVVVFQAIAGITSYVYFRRTLEDASFRTAQVVTAEVARLGSVLPRRVASGEVVSVGSADAMSLGLFVGMLSHIGGSIVAFAVVVGILLGQSPILGLIVLGAVPVMGFALWPLFKAIERRRGQQRSDVGMLNTLGTDTVTGLRVLRGLGGEASFLRRYREASQRVRASGTLLARTQAVLQGVQVLLPGLLLLTLVWVGGRMALTGAITPGELVAFYSYVVFLLRPLVQTIEGINALAAAQVAAGRLASLLAIEPSEADPADPADPQPWPGVAGLADPQTGVRVVPGRFTAITTDDPSRLAGLVDRLARYADPPAELAGVSLDGFTIADVRREIHAHRQDTQLFSGELRRQLDVDGLRADEDIVAALHVAAGLDIVGLDPSMVDRDEPPDIDYDLHQEMAELGRGKSGGERQRLMLARALLTDAPILILDEPTSAVDAHTEGLIANRLVEARRGRTTVVLTSSPSVLAVADEVVFLGESVVSGTHGELRADPAYRQVVSR